VLKNKEEVWKIKLFNIHRKDIRNDLKFKLDTVRHHVNSLKIRKKFWMKMVYTVNCLRLQRVKFNEAHKEWLQQIRYHIASRRIGIHWRRYILQKGEMLSIRNAMILRYSFVYMMQMSIHNPSIEKFNKKVFADYLFDESNKFTVRSKLLKYHKSIRMIQDKIRESNFVRMSRMMILREYWERAMDTIKY
jgi:hypothetical protein